MRKSNKGRFIVNSMERMHTTMLGPLYGAPPPMSSGHPLSTSLVLSLALLVGGAAAIAQDTPTAPVEGIDAMSCK